MIDHVSEQLSNFNKNHHVVIGQDSNDQIGTKDDNDEDND